jgi:ABC-2 type transport system ATP-binding protein
VEALRRAHEILDFCGIEQERYRATETYSSGMRQKLKFAQSIVHDPPLLILDEPTSGLDPTERQSMLGRVRALARKAGKSVLVATHILPDVQAICDTVIVLAKGRVRVVESLEVLSRPQTPAYRVRILGPTDAFFAQLRREGVDVQSDSDGTLTLPRADSAVARRVWALAHQLGVGIRSFTAARNSLEDIFLEAIGEQSGADS